MNAVSQLKQIRERMVEELTQIPEYRALKAMERFIAEMSNIYESLASHEDVGVCQHTPQAVESRHEVDPGSIPSRKVTPYIPAHRVA
jgi:alpha-D-ribose 1-methylphosphonate 5-phosphate C-P lyase